jgi:hypothetical protein
MSQERVDNLFASESWTAVYTAFTKVSLKAYDFDTIREALIDYVSTTYPDKFNDFIASSEFIAILDLVAYMGHSLSFRLDMNTRENFLDTAERRESVLRMAKTLGYNKTRPTNARGFLKITSVTTDQPIADNEGNSLANRTINWNDSNNVDWYENFIDVINASLSKTSKIQDPMSSLVVAGVENHLYEINQNLASRAVSFAFEAPVAGGNRRFEAVRTTFTDGKMIEAEPIESKKFTIVNRNDNLGPASDRTGFFVFAKTGKLQFQNFTYNNKISNLIETLATPNISNTDVWVQKVDTTNTYSSSVSKVDNDTRETAIYNSLRSGSGDLVSVNTIDNNAISLHYGDGVFGNAASGNYRVWYRVADNENYRIDRNDINDQTVSIPYIGADNKNYRLVVTLSSTKDFSENFAAETYTSVRRIAPRSYYAQDRMVNAQDYNVLPLSLGSNIVSKVKAVNTTFAGNSRYFEMDDITGHHSNISITGNDGSVYMDDDVITMNLQFNRQNNNAVDFVRNEMTKAIRHPSLVNLYYSAIRKNPVTGVIDPYAVFDVSIAYTVSGKSMTATMGVTSVAPGDHIKLIGVSGTEYWTRVEYGEGAPISNDTFTITDVIPESGSIETVIRGYRTRFDDQFFNEISPIVTKIQESPEDFVIKYIFDAAIDPIRWVWVLHDVATAMPEGTVNLTFTYNSGIRDNEAEYTVRFTGKRVVFESHDQVKFYYGNEEIVVDNETNLAERDALHLTHKVTTLPESSTTIGDTSGITIGYAPMTNYVQTGNSADFDVNLKFSGAQENYDYAETQQSETYHHFLVSPDGIEYELDKAVNITAPASPNNIVGTAGTNLLSMTINDVTSYVSSIDAIALSENTADSNEFIVQSDHLNIVTDGDFANADTSYTTVSENDIISLGIKGKPSATYFSSAASVNKFFWIDENELPTAETYASAIPPMIGVQTEFISAYTNVYTFTFPTQTNWAIDKLDNNPDRDVRFKQIAYGECSFTPLNALIATTSTLIIKDGDNVISTDHCELIVDAVTNLHRVIFWTYDPAGVDIDFYIGDATQTSTIDNFYVKITAAYNTVLAVSSVSDRYENVSSLVYDKYITEAGYTDNTKLKLLHSDDNNDPFGMLQIVNDDNIILETYFIDTNKFQRVSTTAIATDDVQLLSTIARLWFDGSDWYIRAAGSWVGLQNYQIKINNVWTSLPVDNTDVHTYIQYDGVEYTVVDGKTYVEDKFMSFRWDHFADVDKRIDPSTSNIIDMYVLTTDYVRNINEWIAGGFGSIIPKAPNNFELRKVMETLADKTAIADHVSYIPVKFKMLFGDFADAENQATFKVIAKLGTVYTKSEIKNVVSAKVNEYFKLENWDFGDQFYFSELASYLHQELADYISSVIITPKFASNDFKNLLSISCEQHEIFLSVVTSKDVKIISSISDNELTGE